MTTGHLSSQGHLGLPSSYPQTQDSPGGTQTHRPQGFTPPWTCSDLHGAQRWAQMHFSRVWIVERAPPPKHRGQRGFQKPGTPHGNPTHWEQGAGATHRKRWSKKGSGSMHGTTSSASGVPWGSQARGLPTEKGCQGVTGALMTPVRGRNDQHPRDQVSITEDTCLHLLGMTQFYTEPGHLMAFSTQRCSLHSQRDPKYLEPGSPGCFSHPPTWSPHRWRSRDTALL